MTTPVCRELGGVADAGDGAGKSSKAFCWDKKAWLLALLLVLAVMAAFWPVVGAEFVSLDDEADCYGNPRIMGGLTPGNVVWAATARQGGLWMPMTRWSFQLDATLVKLLGREHPPMVSYVVPMPDAMVFHVHNMLLHAATAVIVFALLYRATGRRGVSFWVAMIWAVHPLRVESVGWVVERKDVLSGFYGFLALYLYIVWVQRRGRVRYWLVAAAMAVSLMAKPTFVTLPVVMLALDFWPLGRMKRLGDVWRLSLEKWPLIVLAMLRSAVTMVITRGIRGMPMEMPERLGHSAVSYVRYLWMQVDVSSLGVLYPYETERMGMVIGAVVLLAAITGLCVWQRKRRPWLIAGWAWYVIAFVPMIGVVQVSIQSHADRFSYFPAVGLLAMVMFSIPKGWFVGARRWAVAALGVAVTVTLGAFTVRQCGYWHDTIRLGERTLAVTTPNHLIVRMLAHGYLQAGRPDDAIREYTYALERWPMAEIHIELCDAYLGTGQRGPAIEHARKAVEMNPDKEPGHLRLANALAMDGQFQEALEHYQRCLEIAPDDQMAREGMEKVRALQGGAAAP